MSKATQKPECKKKAKTRKRNKIAKVSRRINRRKARGL